MEYVSYKAGEIVFEEYGISTFFSIIVTKKNFCL